MTDTLATLALAATEAEDAIGNYLEAYPGPWNDEESVDFDRITATCDLAFNAFHAAATPSVVLALTAALDRARAEAEAYRRGWRLIAGVWYDDAPQRTQSGMRQCIDDSLVSHLASLEKPNG